MHGNQDSSRVDLEFTDHFVLLRGLQGPSRFVTVFLGTLWSSIKEVKALFVFDAEHGIALNAMQGNRTSSFREA